MLYLCSSLDYLFGTSWQVVYTVQVISVVLAVHFNWCSSFFAGFISSADSSRKVSTYYSVCCNRFHTV